MKNSFRTIDSLIDRESLKDRYIVYSFPRHKYSKEPVAATLSNPWTIKPNETNEDDILDCDCYLWRKPEPMQESKKINKFIHSLKY